MCTSYFWMWNPSWSSLLCYPQKSTNIQFNIHFTLIYAIKVIHLYHFNIHSLQILKLISKEFVHKYYERVFKLNYYFLQNNSNDRVVDKAREMLIKLWRSLRPSCALLIKIVTKQYQKKFWESKSKSNRMLL